MAARNAELTAAEVEVAAAAARAGPKAAQRPGDALWVAEWEEGRGEKTIRTRSAANSDVLLYCSWFCPYAQRAWIALEEKGVAYKYVEVNPYRVDAKEVGGYTKKSHPLAVKRALFPDFVATSPRGLVPAVNNGGERVWESLQTIEYVDERFEGPALLPTDAHERALVRIWTAHVGERVQKAFYTLLMEQDVARQAAARERFFTEARTLARAMAASGPFFLGDRFSMVDIAMAPFWQRFVWVGSHYRGLSFPDDPEFRRLDRWWQAVQRRPSVAATMVCRPRLIASYSQYSRNAGTSDYAKNLQSALSSTTQAKGAAAQPSGSALLPAVPASSSAVLSSLWLPVAIAAGFAVGYLLRGART